MMLDLAEYQIDPVRGFLPSSDPLTQLPDAFAEWDRLAAALPDLIVTGQVRPRLERLRSPDLSRLEHPAERERAMLVISALGMGYLWGAEPPVARLPAALAVPWHEVAKTLGRPPIITHASIVLNNWRRLDPEGPLSLENLTCIQHFLGGRDERWFFTTTVALEAAGAAALRPLVEAKAAAEAGNAAVVAERLRRVAAVFERVCEVLGRMYEKCKAQTFYRRIRPFLTGWDTTGLVFEGVSETPTKLHGGSAAQSSLIQSFDAGLGIEHHHPETRPFLLRMRDYMPPLHRRFVEDLGQGPSVHDFVTAGKTETPALADAFNACIDRLSEFRRAHLEIAVQYVVRQGPDGAHGVGTGGTKIVPFLSEARRETDAYAVGEHERAPAPIRRDAP